MHTDDVRGLETEDRTERELEWDRIERTALTLRPTMRWPDSSNLPSRLGVDLQGDKMDHFISNS